MTAAAEIVSCTELNQQAMIAADNFPGVYRGKCCGHVGWELPERGQNLLELNTQVPNLWLICVTMAVDVNKYLMRNPGHSIQKPDRTKGKTE
jgi:hypothetical protein